MGFFVNPLLTVYSRGMTVADVLLLPLLPAYRLRPGSPLIGKAVGLAPLDVGKQDFFENPLPAHGHMNIGACAITRLQPAKR